MERKQLISLAIPLAFAACSGSGTAAALPQAGVPGDQPLRDATARLAVAWNAGDGEAWAAEYWPDGSLVNILGAVFPNAQGVATVTNAILAGPFHGSTYASTVRRLRFVGSNAAIVETDVSVTNYRALPPGAVATQPGLLMTRFIHVFENRNGFWKIAASQNTAVTPQAAPPG